MSAKKAEPQGRTFVNGMTLRQYLASQRETADAAEITDDDTDTEVVIEGDEDE